MILQLFTSKIIYAYVHKLKENNCIYMVGEDIPYYVININDELRLNPIKCRNN